MSINKANTTVRTRVLYLKMWLYRDQPPSWKVANLWLIVSLEAIEDLTRTNLVRFLDTLKICCTGQNIFKGAKGHCKLVR